MSAYAEISLNSKKREIRLLCLEPAAHINTTIRASLCVSSLLKEPKYEALSYTWGTAQPEEKIELNGEPFPVRENLFAALRRLRDIQNPRILWVDAICINQDSLSERRNQVLLMGHIYRQADGVVIWLGEMTVDLIVGTSLLRSFVSNTWHHTRSELAKRHYSMNYFKKYFIGPIAMEERMEYSQEHAHGEIRELLDRPWWRRVWIIQEAVLARQVKLICGTETIEWDDLDKIPQGGTLSKNKITAFGYRIDPLFSWPDASYQAISRLRSTKLSQGNRASIYDLLYDFRSSECTDPRDRIYAFLGLAGDIDGADLVPNYAQSVSEVYINTARALISHHKHLRVLSCTRPLGPAVETSKQTRTYLLADQMRYHDTDALVIDGPGKRPRTSWARLPSGWERRSDGNTVYYVNHHTQTRSDVSPLKHRPPELSKAFKTRQICPDGWSRNWDNLGRIHLEYEGAEQTMQSDSSSESMRLPSWVPDWTRRSAYDPTPLLALPGSTCGFSASGRKTICDIAAHTEANVLELKGLLYDEISSLAPAWHPTPEALPISARHAPELELWEDLASADVPSCPYGSLEGREEAFWRVLLADDVGEGATPEEDIELFFVWREGNNWAPELPSDDPIKAWDMQWYRSGARIESHMFNYWRKTTEDKSFKRVLSLGTKVKKQYEHFVQRLVHASAHRAFFVSNSGFMGLAPWNARVGDKIAILSGGRTPFLLRNCPESNNYTLVGEAYVQGLMAGEALQSKKEVETIIIE